MGLLNMCETEKRNLIIPPNLGKLNEFEFKNLNKKLIMTLY